MNRKTEKSRPRSNASRAYELALKAAQRQRPDLPKALSLLRTAHAGGDPRAAYALGTWHLHGHAGLPRDMARAVALLREAADADVRSAQFDLAVCYERGAGVRKNLKKAMVLFMKSALQGDRQGARAVGKCYWHGLGVKRDRPVARVWLDYGDRPDDPYRPS